MFLRTLLRMGNGDSSRKGQTRSEFQVDKILCRVQSKERRFQLNDISVTLSSGRSYRFEVSIAISAAKEVCLFLNNPNDGNLNLKVSITTFEHLSSHRMSKTFTKTLSQNKSYAQALISLDELKKKPELYLANGALHFSVTIVVEEKSARQTTNGDSSSGPCLPPPSTSDSNLKSDFCSMLGDKEFSDFKIICGSKPFHVHKNILASRSNVFKTMFRNTSMSEGKSNVMFIEDCRSEVLTRFLEFVYTGDLVDKRWFTAIELLVLADKYDVQGLKSKCEFEISTAINKANVLMILSTSHKLNAQFLFDKSSKYVSQNLTTLYETQEWKTYISRDPDVLNCLMKYLSKN